MVVTLATTVSSLASGRIKVQFDKSNYSTVRRSSCLVHVQWMKALFHQSRTVDPYHLNVCIALVHSYVCLGCVCVWVNGWWGVWVG